eukprot:2296085-Pyramimonas_sp.AAC.1
MRTFGYDSPLDSSPNATTLSRESSSPLYGIRQVGREWFITNCDFILNHDPRWQQSAVEAQLYFISDIDSTLFCVVLVHTDDYFGICNDDMFWNEFEQAINKRFNVDVKGE